MITLTLCFLKGYWSRGRELNSRPADYESAALPLSYLGFASAEVVKEQALVLPNFGARLDS